MEHSSQTILTAFNTVLKQGRVLLTESRGKSSDADELQEFSSKLSLMNDRVKEVLDLATNLSAECNEKSFEIKNTVGSNKTDGFKFVYRGTKSLNWGGMLAMEEKRETLVDDINKKTKELDQKNALKFKNLTEIDGVKIHPLRLPVVSRLEIIPVCLHWYNGDKRKPKGIYICPYPNMYIKVPLMDLVDGSKYFSRSGSIKCKNGSIVTCRANRKHLAAKFSSPFRECTYAHEGEIYKKIGMNYRAPDMPSIGNFRTLLSDLERVSYRTVKIMMMYALSDLLLCSMWCSANKITNPVVFHDIDTCQ